MTLENGFQEHLTVSINTAKHTSYTSPRTILVYHVTFHFRRVNLF